MNSLDSLKVVPYSLGYVPNAYPGGSLPWQEYHTVRNALVETCRKYGPTGPMGLVKIVADVENPNMMLGEDDFWELGDPNAWYFIIDDQLNHDRYCYAELYGDDPFNAGWLLSITATLRKYEGWGLAISNIPNSYLLIFGKKLMVNGCLARCKSAVEIVQTASRLLKRGEKKWWQFWK